MLTTLIALFPSKKKRGEIDLQLIPLRVDEVSLSKTIADMEIKGEILFSEIPQIKDKQISFNDLMIEDAIRTGHPLNSAFLEDNRNMISHSVLSKAFKYLGLEEPSQSSSPKSVCEPFVDLKFASVFDFFANISLCSFSIFRWGFLIFLVYRSFKFFEPFFMVLFFKWKFSLKKFFKENFK